MLAMLRLISIKLIFCFLFLSIHQRLSSFVLMEVAVGPVRAGLPGGEGTALHCCCSTGKEEVWGQPSSTYLLLAGVGKTFQAAKIASDKLP